MAGSSSSVLFGIDRFFAELAEGARRQGNVIFALIFRQFLMASPSRSALSMLWVLIEPTTNALTMAMFWMLIQRTVLGGVPPMLYLLVSFLPYLILHDGVGVFAKALTSNTALFAFQRVKPIDLMLSRMIVDITLMVCGTAMMLFLLYWFFDYTVFLDQIGWVIYMLAITVALSIGLSLLVGTYGNLYPIIFTILGLLSRVLLIASGVIIAPQDFPYNLQVWFAWNPSAVIIDQMRVALFHTPPIPGTSIPYCLFVTLCINAAGFAAYYSKRHKLAVDA